MKQQNKVILEMIIAFIKSKTDVAAGENTVLFRDLQIDGLDAVTFMNDFFVKFNVNPRKYDYQKYSTSERDITNIFKLIAAFFLKKKSLEKKTFSVKHMVKVVKNGEWQDP